MPIVEPLFRFTAAIVEGAPENPGVLALWNRSEMIYLGRAASIRQRLRELLQASAQPCLQEASHYSWELSLRPGPREADLLEQYRERHGRLPRCNEAA